MTEQKSEAAQIADSYFQAAFGGLEADDPVVQLAIQYGYADFQPLPEEEGITQLALTPLGRELLESVAQVHIDIAEGARPEQASIKIRSKGRALVDAMDDRIRDRVERNRHD